MERLSREMSEANEKNKDCIFKKKINSQWRFLSISYDEALRKSYFYSQHLSEAVVTPGEARAHGCGDPSLVTSRLGQYVLGWGC